MKKILWVLIPIGMLFFLTACHFEPEETYRISNLIEMRIQPYTRTEFKMTTPATVLNKEDIKDGAPLLYGTIYEAVYALRDKREIKLIAGSTDANRIADELWRYYRKEDAPPFWTWVNYIPFFYGSYETEGATKFAMAWFSKKWVFRIVGPDEETVQDFYKKMIAFIEKEEIFNGSIREI
ncbi:MAG: hypothetical protein PHX90_04315 [Thermotogota bacterium]|nr:hypothetical protein [Thermotogota bacterium]